MTNTFPLLLSSPDGDLFRGDVIFFSVRGTEGDLAIMAGHTPFMTAVVPCDAKIILADDSEKFARIDGGLLTVSPDAVTLLSTGVTWKE